MRIWNNCLWMLLESLVCTMINLFLAERMKLKHRFVMKLLWLVPFISVSLSLLLMGGQFYVEGSFNWWYTTLLPGSLAMIIAFNISAEKRHNYHGLFAIIVDKRKLWLSKVLVNTLLLFITTFIFFVFQTLIGSLLGLPVPLVSSLVASIVLFITFAWQIPFFMFVSDISGSFTCIILALLCNIGFGTFMAPSPLWWLPFSIPARLMCPIIHVLPNGLPLDIGHRLADPSVIPIGILITTTLYLIISILTTYWFHHKEVH